MSRTTLLSRPALALVLATAAAAAAADPRPNVILFLVDDMGWRDCEPYGSTYYETPRLTRFARESMRFTDYYALPLCSPTRASILTGLHTSRHGVTSASGHQPPQPPDHVFLPESGPPNRAVLYPESKNYLDPAFPTLAEAFRAAGYRTAHLGKWHLGTTEPHWPEAQGFDVAFHCHPDPGPPGAYFSPYGVVPPGTPPPPKVPGAPRAKHLVGTITDGPPGEYITDRLTDEAVAFLRAQKAAGTPFFLNLWHYGVHGPWGHKEAYTAEFARKTDPSGLQGNPIMASMLRSIDESLGRLLDELDALGLADSTVVAFSSDNGGNVHSNLPGDAKAESHPDWRKWAGDRPPTNNAPLRDGKGRLYEGGIRVPLMVRWPGRIAAASTSSTVAGCIDLYPTLLGLAGVPVPSGHRPDGLSLVPVLLGTGAVEREAYFTWFPHLVPGVAVRSGNWKLIRRFEERPEDYAGLHELFDLGTDPGETTNLASRHPDKVRELDALIDRFLADTGALRPKPNPAHAPRPASPQRAARTADPAAGLVPKQCRTEFLPAPDAGILRVTGTGADPFLGTAAIRHDGPLRVELRLRAEQGGTGRIAWSTADAPEFTADRSVSFSLAADASWHDVTISVPVSGPVKVLRLHLPARDQPVDLAILRVLAGDGARPLRAWTFAAPPPDRAP
jgi:arylsulfatase A-like enzyme